MSKIIKLTPECIEECRRDFEKMLASAKAADGKISYTKVFADTKKKAKLLFTPLAWVKMTALVNGFDKEVAWHGIASRYDSGDNSYLVSDILIYPQTVTGTTVDMDEMKYATWQMSLTDDEANGIHLQGHSHVNMGVTPSSTDLMHQEDMLRLQREDSFYIFVIWNKKGEHNIKIYDLALNTLFENGDVEVSIGDDEFSLADFSAEAKTLVAEKYTYNAGGYSGSQYGGGSHNTTYTPAANANKTPATTALADASKNATEPKEKPKTTVSSDWKGGGSYKPSYNNYYDNDDWYNYDYGYGYGYRNSMYSK